MSTTIDKTLARVHERVKNHEFYEAHQAVRTIVARYLRKREYGSAIGLLYSSALLLAKSHQTGSASDLLLYMIKTYEDAKLDVNGPNKGRIAEIALHLDCRDAVIKQVAQKALVWAHDDAELAHTLGTIFVHGGNIYEAEKYLLLGTRESAQLLGLVHARWAAAGSDAEVQGLFLSRGVLGYLSIQNIRNALAYVASFKENSDSPVAGPVAEFVTLLITTCQTKNPQLYRKLSEHYRPLSVVPAWEPALQTIEQDFFGIVPQRPFNIMDMMGSIMK